MTEDNGQRSRWTEDPGSPLTRLIGIIASVLAEADIPECNDLKGIIVLHDGHGHGGAGMVGYDEQDPHASLITDFIAYSQHLFAASGIRLDVSFTTEEPEHVSDAIKPVLETSDPGQPRAVLTITPASKDPRVDTLAEAIKTLLEKHADFSRSKTFILMQPDGDGATVILHHGYSGGTPEVTATLLQCCAQLAGPENFLLMDMESPN